MGKRKEAVWPFKGKLPKKFTVPKDCVCTEYGMSCAGPGDMTFEKTKEGWKVENKLSPLKDEEAKFIFESCSKKTAGVKKTAQRELDTAIHGIHPDRLKELKDDPTFQKHAQTVADYYSTPVVQFCDQIDAQMKLLATKPIEVAMWALSVPTAVLTTYQPLVKAAEYTSSEMVKWFGQQKQAKLITNEHLALQAPKVELSPEYQKILKQDELLNILNVLPITKKKATQLAQQFTAPLLAFCKDANEAKQNAKSNPFLAFTTAVHLPEALVKKVEPTVGESDRAAKQFSDWMVKTKNQMDQKVPGEGKEQVNIDLSARVAKLSDPQLKKILTWAVRKLREVDWGKGPEGQLEKLEQVSDTLSKAGIRPVDVDLAISTWTKDEEKAKKFIQGPSGRGTNKGALGDLQNMLTGLKVGKEKEGNTMLRRSSSKFRRSPRRSSGEAFQALLNNDNAMREILAEITVAIVHNDDLLETIENHLDAMGSFGDSVEFGDPYSGGVAHEVTKIILRRIKQSLGK